MPEHHLNNFIKNIKYDLPASIVVWLVALPLCLGIALASNAPILSGIIAGIIGGIAVGILSKSALGVSGPAAGLVTIVLSSIATLNYSWATFQLAVLIAGIFQLIFGIFRIGTLIKFFPSPVIKGMLTGIGLIIIFKQLPYALGHAGMIPVDILQTDTDLFSRILYFMSIVQISPLCITLISITLLILWEQVLVHKSIVFRTIQGPLAVVIVGILITWLAQVDVDIPYLKIDNIQTVNLSVPHNIAEFVHLFHLPDFSQLTNTDIYKIAFIIALIASIETLLTVEATDKLDPHKRVTPTNRELAAQGVGNMMSGLLGGLPITQTIIRSTSNVSFGAKTKMSTIYHGMLLLLSVLTIPQLLNMIPLASLAAILLAIGYKLSKPTIFITMYQKGMETFIPFIATVIGILLTDLLIGISIGIITLILINFIWNYKNSYQMIKIFYNKMRDE